MSRRTGTRKHATAKYEIFTRRPDGTIGYLPGLHAWVEVIAILEHLIGPVARDKATLARTQHALNLGHASDIAAIYDADHGIGIERTAA